MYGPPELPPSSPVRRLLDRYARPLYRPVRAAYHGWRDWRFRRRYQRLAAAITNRHGWAILAGPFRGMEYVREAHSSALLPKVLGTYELEIQPIVEAAFERRYELVVDIGAAEGYYAVGLALRMPAARVVAFEADPMARERCRELIERNRMADRIDLRGAFDPDATEEFAGRRAFVVCDVDGYEVELFTPARVVAWSRADLLIELHDHLGVPCRETVLEAFSTTHTAEVFDSRARPVDASPHTTEFPSADRLLAVDEIRPPQQWIFLRARTVGVE